MKTSLTIEIASVPDREEVVAEVWAGREQFAELRREGDDLILQLFAPPEGLAWEFGFEEVMTALTTARARLVGGS
jgi:hypothetical protein